MPLNLQSGVYHVRTAIGELQENRWSDAQIVYDLNTSAQEMCSVANLITGFANVPYDASLQEAVLPVEMDQIKAVKYFAGQLYDLEPSNFQTLQSGSYTGSIPLWFYVKTATKVLTPQVDTSDIQLYDLEPSNPAGQDYRTVIGIWPIPSIAGEIHCWYDEFHKVMANPLDTCAVPRRFLSAWAAYAISRCWEIMRDWEGAERYKAIYEKGKEEMRIWAQTKNQHARPTKYGMDEAPWRQSASSSVILVDQTPMM